MPKPSGSPSADPRRDRVACALAAGKTVRAIAQETGIGQRTIYRWIHDPAFAAIVRRYRARLVDRTLGQLARAATRAVATLEKCLGSEADAVKVRAAVAILEQLVRIRESTELEARLAQLEEKIHGTA